MTNTTGAMSTLEREDATASLDGAAVERLGRDAPDWLCQRREHAWSVYEDTPLTTR